jgi:hypothetical protein
VIPPFGIAPSEELGFVLQWAAVGGLIGTALAARQRMKNPDADVTLPPMVWAVLFAIVVGGVALVWGLF